MSVTLKISLDGRQQLLKASVVGERALFQQILLSQIQRVKKMQRNYQLIST